MQGAQGLTRITVRVRPGASRTKVGGSYDDALVVAVGPRAVDGAATEAARRALADAFGLRPADVTLVTGATARTKVFEFRGDPELVILRRDELRGSA